MERRRGDTLLYLSLRPEEMRDVSMVNVRCAHAFRPRGRASSVPEAQQLWKEVRPSESAPQRLSQQCDAHHHRAVYPQLAIWERASAGLATSPRSNGISIVPAHAARGGLRQPRSVLQVTRCP